MTTTRNIDSQAIMPLDRAPLPETAGWSALIWYLVGAATEDADVSQTAPATCIACGATTPALKLLVDFAMHRFDDMPLPAATLERLKERLPEGPPTDRVVHCPDCRTRLANDDRMKTLSRWWAMVCPAEYRDTRTDHPLWNAAAWQRFAHWRPDPRDDRPASYYLYGPTGSCKTRAGLMLLHRAAAAGMSSAVLWPEDLKEYKGYVRDRKSKLLEWSAPRYLLLDDPLLVGASNEHLGDFFKDLIEMRMRRRQPVIITSQISLTDYLADARKYSNLSDADEARLAALCRRIVELVEVVPFAGLGDTEAF